MADRKPSPLAEDDDDTTWPGTPQAPKPPTLKPEPAPPVPLQKDTPQSAAAAFDALDQQVQTRSRRRRHPIGKVDDFDMVPFNCKLTRVARKMIRGLAAEQEVDIQDVIEDMAVEYFARRGKELPRRPLPGV